MDLVLLHFQTRRAAHLLEASGSAARLATPWPLINTRGFLLSLFLVVSRCAQAPQVPDAVLLNTWQGSPNPDATGVVARLLAILAHFLLRSSLACLSSVFSLNCTPQRSRSIRSPTPNTDLS